MIIYWIRPISWFEMYSKLWPSQWIYFQFSWILYTVQNDAITPWSLSVSYSVKSTVQAMEVCRKSIYDLKGNSVVPGLLSQGTGITFTLNNHINQQRSEEHTSELQSRETISYAVFCLKKKKLLHALCILHDPLIIPSLSLQFLKY